MPYQDLSRSFPCSGDTMLEETEASRVRTCQPGCGTHPYGRLLCHRWPAQCHPSHVISQGNVLILEPRGDRLRAAVSVIGAALGFGCHYVIFCSSNNSYPTPSFLRNNKNGALIYHGLFSLDSVGPPLTSILLASGTVSIRSWLLILVYP